MHTGYSRASRSSTPPVELIITMRTVLLAVLSLLWLVGVTQSSTISRADLAIRLIETEACWERYRGSEEARLRATQPLSDGITAFFASRFDTLARYLTITCARLRSAEEPSPIVLYAGSIGTRIQRVLDTKAFQASSESRKVQVFRYYDAPAEDEPLSLTLTILNGNQPIMLPLGVWNPEKTWISLPPLSEGDYRIRFELSHEDTFLRAWDMPLSIVDRLNERLNALQEALSAHPDADPIERATVKMTHEVISACLMGSQPETAYPLLQQLRFAEELVAGWKRNQRGWQPKPGDHWMATPYNNRTHYFRLYLPKGFRADKPIPLVIALHGAGGNEHLFFDGYGLGQALREAEKYGWAIVAPRSGASLDHVWASLEAVQKLVSVDTERIYLMGHSMGGAQTFACAGQRPNLFRAIAVFAGAGQPTNLLKDLPVFLAVGEQELPFLMNNVERAYRQLQAQELKVLEFKRYNGCEHLMIVREALPDAFAFLAQAPPRQSSE